MIIGQHRKVGNREKWTLYRTIYSGYLRGSLDAAFPALPNHQPFGVTAARVSAQGPVELRIER
jgi:hypothetical protein